MSRREPKDNETQSDNIVALLNQALTNRYWFLPVQFSLDGLDPVGGQIKAPYRFSFRFPQSLQYEQSRNSLYQLEMVQYAIIRSASPPAPAPANLPIFLFVDFNGDDFRTPYLSVINTGSTDGIALPVQLNDKLPNKAFTVTLSYDRNRTVLATNENITDVIFTFKYSIRSL